MAGLKGGGHLIRQEQGIDTVLEVIEKETPSHGCFVKSQGTKRDGWFMFEFHLPDDPGRSVQLAVLVFHFP